MDVQSEGKVKFCLSIRILTVKNVHRQNQTKWRFAAHIIIVNCFINATSCYFEKKNLKTDVDI